MEDSGQSPPGNPLFQTFEYLDSIKTRSRLRLGVSVLIHVAFLLAFLIVHLVNIISLPTKDNGELLTMLKLSPVKPPESPSKSDLEQTDKNQFELIERKQTSKDTQAEPPEAKSAKSGPSRRSTDAVGLTVLKDVLDPKLDPAHASEIVRMYLGILMRRPEPGGLMNWASHLMTSDCSGAACEAVLTEIAEYFVGSPEFKSVFGADLSTQEFVKLIYRNILRRLPSTSETQRWQKDLDTKHLTRGQMARALINSEEFVNRTKYDVFVIAAYATVARRLPEDAEFNKWRDGLSAGQFEPADLIQSLANAIRH